MKLAFVALFVGAVGMGAPAHAEASERSVNECLDYEIRAAGSTKRSGWGNRHKAWLRQEQHYQVLEVVAVPGPRWSAAGCKWIDKVTLQVLDATGVAPATDGVRRVTMSRWWDETASARPRGVASKSPGRISVQRALEDLKHPAAVAFGQNDSITETVFDFYVRIDATKSDGTTKTGAASIASVMINIEAPLWTVAVTSQPGRFLALFSECRDVLALDGASLDALVGDGACDGDPFKTIAMSNVSTAPIGLRLRVAPWIRAHWAGISVTASAVAIGGSGVFDEVAEQAGVDTTAVVGPGVAAPLDIFAGFDFQLPTPVRVSLILGAGGALTQFGDAYRFRPTAGIAITTPLTEHGPARFGGRSGAIGNSEAIRTAAITHGGAMKGVVALLQLEAKKVKDATGGDIAKRTPPNKDPAVGPEAFLAACDPNPWPDKPYAHEGADLPTKAVLQERIAKLEAAAAPYPELEATVDATKTLTEEAIAAREAYDVAVDNHATAVAMHEACELAEAKKPLFAPVDAEVEAMLLADAGSPEVAQAGERIQAARAAIEELDDRVKDVREAMLAWLQATEARIPEPSTD